MLRRLRVGTVFRYSDDDVVGLFSHLFLPPELSEESPLIVRQTHVLQVGRCRKARENRSEYPDSADSDPRRTRAVLPYSVFERFPTTINAFFHTQSLTSPVNIAADNFR